MIVLDFDSDARFHYRVAAVFIYEGHVFLHRADYEHFWSLPGGRAEILETSTTALQREMREELSAEVRIGRLLWVVENFFTFESRRFHEMGLCYQTEFPAGSDYLDTNKTYPGLEVDGPPLIFRWFPVSRLPEVKVRPSFLESSLAALPDATEHIVHLDPVDLQAGPRLTG